MLVWIKTSKTGEQVCYNYFGGRLHTMAHWLLLAHLLPQRQVQGYPQFEGNTFLVHFERFWDTLEQHSPHQILHTLAQSWWCSNPGFRAWWLDRRSHETIRTDMIHYRPRVAVSSNHSIGLLITFERIQLCSPKNHKTRRELRRYDRPLRHYHTYWGRSTCSLLTWF